MGNYAISSELLKAYEQKKIVPLPLIAASASEFQNAIKVAKQVNAYGMFVDKHSVVDYERMTTILTSNKTAGVAIEDDGNIVSLFSSGRHCGVIRTLLPVAIWLGGRKLDNYSSARLSAMYEMYGFYPISKVAFDREYAPENWNYDRDKEPDIVFWIHNGDSAADVVQRLGSYMVTWNHVESFATYEEARAYRDLKYEAKFKTHID